MPSIQAKRQVFTSILSTTRFTNMFIIVEQVMLMKTVINLSSKKAEIKANPARDENKKNKNE